MTEETETLRTIKYVKDVDEVNKTVLIPFGRNLIQDWAYHVVELKCKYPERDVMEMTLEEAFGENAERLAKICKVHLKLTQNRKY